MKWVRFFSIALVSLVQVAVAGDYVQEIAQPIQRSFIPNGYDSNDSVQIVVEGEFDNLCYQLGRADSMVDKEKRIVEVKLTAYQYSGTCPRTPARFHHVLHLGRMPLEGKYLIVDMTTKKTIGKLQIDHAEELTPGTDDALYAPLLDAVLLKREGKNVLLLRGVFATSCMSLGEVKVKIDKDVVLVLPQMEFQRTPDCKLGEYPFEKVIPIDQELPTEASYLLHARSMAGQSINKVMHVRPE